MPVELRSRVTKSRAEKLAKAGLHFCSYYRNLVRYEPEFCRKCPYNGLRHLTDDSKSETCF